MFYHVISVCSSFFSSFSLFAFALLTSFGLLAISLVIVSFSIGAYNKSATLEKEQIPSHQTRLTLEWCDWNCDRNWQRKKGRLSKKYRHKVKLIMPEDFIETVAHLQHLQNAIVTTNDNCICVNARDTQTESERAREKNCSLRRKERERNDSKWKKQQTNQKESSLYPFYGRSALLQQRIIWCAPLVFFSLRLTYAGY